METWLERAPHCGRKQTWTEASCCGFRGAQKEGRACMATLDPGVLSTPECREIMHADILVKINFCKMTQEKLTLYSLGYWHSGSCFSVSTISRRRRYERGKPSYLHAQNREDRVKKSWPGGNPVMSADLTNTVWSVPQGSHAKARSPPERSTKVQVTGPLFSGSQGSYSVLGPQIFHLF